MKPRKFIRLFQPRFADQVESGIKKQTIRLTPKRMPQVGDHISLRTWTGKPYRSKQRILRESIITEVDTITICHDRFIRCGYTYTAPYYRNSLAVADGFTDWADMITWFQDNHQHPFSGILIQWD